jgi:hypothetical protein
LLAIWTLAAIPFIGFLFIGGLMTLLMIHRQIPAIAREVGSWFAPLRRSHR